MTQAAQSNNVKTQYFFALLYYNGKYIMIKSVFYLAKAADNNHEISQNKVAKYLL